MSTLAKWISRDVSAGWGELIFRSVLVALVAYVVLELKELFEVGAFDPPASIGDALLIAAAVFVVNAFLKLLKF
jgi:hypothetical protein